MAAVLCWKCGNIEFVIIPYDVEVNTLDTIYEITCKSCNSVLGHMKYVVVNKKV